jgi:hypothetical protein
LLAILASLAFLAIRPAILPGEIDPGTSAREVVAAFPTITR